MSSLQTLQVLAQEHGTPLVVVDHAVLRNRYEEFRRQLPRVQVYYAVKANAEPAIRTRCCTENPMSTVCVALYFAAWAGLHGACLSEYIPRE